MPRAAIFSPAIAALTAAFRRPALAAGVAGVLLCLTIVGIPLGIACFKLVPLALLPFGKEIVPVDEALPATVAYRPPPTPGGRARP